MPGKNATDRGVKHKNRSLRSNDIFGFKNRTLIKSCIILWKQRLCWLPRWRRRCWRQARKRRRQATRTSSTVCRLTMSYRTCHNKGANIRDGVHPLDDVKPFAGSFRQSLFLPCFPPIYMLTASLLFRRRKHNDCRRSHFSRFFRSVSLYLRPYRLRLTNDMDAYPNDIGCGS